jgi:hypothetical protein
MQKINNSKVWLDEDTEKLTKILKMNMFNRDHKQAFENAISKGLNNPESWMYMYSQDNKDFFKNISMRNYINFEFKIKEVA